MRTLLLGLVGVALFAQSDPLSSPGFQHFYNLEYDQAIDYFEKVLAAAPNDPDARNHVAQCLEFRELFRVGALESELVSGSNSFLGRPKIDVSPEIEKEFFAQIQKSIDLTQAELAKNPDDTRALYSQGVAYGLRANWNFLVRKAWRDSLRDFTTGRNLHNRVTELEPANYDARLEQGVHDYVVGSLPLLYKLLGFLAGFHGDKEGGIRTIQAVASKGVANRVDAQIFLCALYRREQRWKEAEPLLTDLAKKFPRNYLLRFEQAQLYSSVGDKTRAIGAIETVADLKRKDPQAYASLAWERIYFQFGNIQFWYRDYGPAIENLKKVNSGGGKVDLNTSVLAWMRLGQIYDLTNRRKQAVDAYKRAIATGPDTEGGQESRRYLSSPYKRG
jgi:tetratricopeptide (TPR) repeat protein